MSKPNLKSAIEQHDGVCCPNPAPDCAIWSALNALKEVIEMCVEVHENKSGLNIAEDRIFAWQTLNLIEHDLDLGDYR